jgi:DUF1365 family protein
MKAERITSVEENGPPPDAAGTLYPGKVMHQRLQPFGHRFSYSASSRFWSMSIGLPILPD